MSTNYWTTFFAFISFPLFSQTHISGIINQYAKVNALDLCEARLTVSDGSLFEMGDHVLLIQMKGAEINASNTGSFGNIEDLGGAGLFEKNEVVSVAGNEIYLKNELLNQYNTAGSVQVVQIPVYNNAEVVGELTAQPWDGETGGVLILEADELSLQASINVSALGFRGAQQILVASDCTFFTNADDFHYSTSNWRGSPKGEGIADPVSGKEHGRGAHANGGGGGNDHNSGGGGGGNVVNGGIGGKQSASGFGCDGDYAGRGGKACPGEPDRIYLGGGGGTGHFDDDGAGSSGSNGGGIAIILAQTIEGNGFAIFANGAKSPIAQGDGAGGGGAGGTILIKSNLIVGDLSMEANGGGGGDVNNTPDRCNGAGGGGSGGRLLSNLNNFAQVSLIGAQPGINTVPSGECNGVSNGAEAGEDGIQANFGSFPASQNEIVALEILAQPTDVVACSGLQLDINFDLQGNYLDYQWQVNTGSGWQNVPNNANYAGATSNSLTILDPVPAMNGFEYRCLVTSPCISDLYSDEVSLVMNSLPEADFGVASLGNGTYQFQNNSVNATDFVWDFGDGETSMEAHPEHSYSDFGNYLVTLFATGPCGEDVYSFQLTVTTAPTAGFSFQNSGFCAPQTVQFTNQSSSNAVGFEWLFPGGSPSISSATSPVVEYSTSGLFDVTLIVSNTEGNDTLIMPLTIEVGGPPVADFSLNVSNLTVSFSNLSLNATNGFLWDFGDGTTSDVANPVHVYASQGLFQVTLTAFNDCGEVTLTQSVPTGSLPLAQFSADFTSGCHPMTVHFQNQSSGTNLTGFSWEFPGGTPSFSTEENPVVIYSTPGTYTVTLTVTSPIGSHTTEQLGFVEVQLTPAAEFSFLVDEMTVYFSNESLGGNFYNWDFGDGTSSQAVNPVHEYASPGQYEVALTVGNLSCGSAISHSVFLVPSAIGEAEQQPCVVVFPNPVSDFFTVNLPQNSVEKSEMRLLDSRGIVCQVIDFQGDAIQVDMREQAFGIYFIEIPRRGKTLAVKLLKL